MKRFLIPLALLASTLLSLTLPGASAAQEGSSGSYPELRARAERHFAEGSFELARRLYEEADELELEPGDARWVDFRRADAAWRSAAATDQPDSTALERARKALEVLVRDVERPEDRDRLWAEVQESLGDFHWDRRGSSNWYSAWPYYQQALEWWGRSTDLELARGRYLAVVRRMARPHWYQPGWEYGSYGNRIPVEVLRNAVEIADTADDADHARFLLGQTLRQVGDWSDRNRAGEAFRSIVEREGERTEWYDDALFHLAAWLEEGGRRSLNEHGGWEVEYDYVGAAALYRRMLAEFPRGESRYVPQAQERLKRITAPELTVGVGSAFLPGSEVGYSLGWRNVRSVELALYELDLTRDVRFTHRDQGQYDWIERPDVARLELLRRWTHDTKDDGRHLRGSAELHLESAPGPGAYLLEARAAGAGAASRALVLVSDAGIVLKASGSKVLLFACDAVSGAPLAEADVALWHKAYDGNQWNWRQVTGVTGADGTALFEVAGNHYREELFAAARSGERQAFSLGYKSSTWQDSQDWKLYTSTDRPAYRPLDTVSWKVVARSHDGGAYVTPAGARLAYALRDPRGATVEEGELELNEFGSGWATFETTESMALGEYQVRFETVDGNRRHSVGGTTLFRLEEYKLPEFEVSVELPEVDGQSALYSMGDEVEAEVVASYYFGGPVAKASVELLVYQRPYYPSWRPRREFDWFQSELSRPQPMWWGGPGQIVSRQTLVTDDTGRASFRFDTPAGATQDFEYTIEARVTDASRREVSGSDTLRVTRQSYFAYANATHNLHRPGEPVEIELRTVDANDGPVSVEGRLGIVRRRWVEVWLDPAGREVSGEALARLRRGSRPFPPPATGNRSPWRLKFSGYEEERLESTTVRTGADGSATHRFTAPAEGYYQVTWRGVEEDGSPVAAETTVWVCDESTRVLGWHHGGVELLVDKDVFVAGQRAPIMISVPTSDRHVLFTVEREELLEHRVVHVEGNVKLLTLDLTEAHVPNLFLGALMVADGQAFTDQERVIVPPVAQFLDVELIADREQVEPGEEGELTVCVRDHLGRPVTGEVGLALVDEAVTAIQSEYAGDPREFFYGSPRPHRVTTQSSFHSLNYLRGVLDDSGRVIDERQASAMEREERDQLQALGYAGEAKLAKKDSRQSGARLNERAERSAPAAEGLAMADQDGAAPMSAPAASGASGAPDVRVRSDFRKTALWLPDLVTDEEGCATVTVRYPDSLTRWQGTARVADRTSRFGIARVTTRTQKPLMARLQAPRFFQVGDELVLSAILNNRTEADLDVRPTIVADGLVVVGRLESGLVAEAAGPVRVAANGEARVDWLVRVEEPGEAHVSITAVGGDHADAMERSYPVFERGAELFVARSGKFTGDGVEIALDLPTERRPGSTELVVQVAPSMAVTMLDALPYLVRYPYGCTEQTLSRFLPAVVVKKTLADFGLSPEDAMGRVFGGIERSGPGAAHPVAGAEPSLKELDAVTRAGLDRLTDFQHGDGGWGWWKEGDSDPFMTAYVVWGLTLAWEAGVDVERATVERGARFLSERLVEAEQATDLQAWMLHALAKFRSTLPHATADARFDKAFANLWKERARLNAYTRALLALAAHDAGREDEANVLVRNLVNGVISDDAPDTSVIARGSQSSHAAVQATAHWGEDGLFWRWSQGGVEATATALRALLAIDPDHELVAPVTNWLVRNRRGAQWSNTRDTAMTVLALNDYLRTSDELGSAAGWELTVNGEVVASVDLEPDELLRAPTRHTVDPALLLDGANRIEIRRTRGDGSLYFATHAKYFSTEQPIPAHGNEVFVRRDYYRIVGRPTLLAGYAYEKVPLADGDELESGDRVEVVVTIETKNHLEYLLFEDFKPAGLESVEQKSGGAFHARELKSSETEHRFEARDASFDRTAVRWDEHAAGYTGRSRWVHRELRDRKIALFLDQCPEGVWEMRYELRAEIPGRFSALPVLGHAMYVPEIRCNSAEWRVAVVDG